MRILTVVRRLGVVLTVLGSALVIAALPRAAHAQAASFIVDSTADAVDANPGDGQCRTAAHTCTLRAAIMETNALSSPDTISLRPGVYTLTIPGTDDEARLGDLDITHTSGGLRIFGPSATTGAAIIDGGGLDRVFDICCQTNTVHLERVTIRNGRAGQQHLGFKGHGHGAGIHTHGRLTLKDVTVSGNTVENPDPSAKAWGGGGVTNGCGRQATATTATCALHANGDLTMTNVTISGNTVTHAAGFDPAKRAKGGGLDNGGVARATNVTISNNTVTPGGQGSGIFNNTTTADGFVSLTNTIVAGNASQNCLGTITSGGANLSDGTSCALSQASDRMSVDPRLGPLQDNGGGIATHGLRRGSPAIDRANSSACPAADARGVARPQDGDGNRLPVCDIGAYETRPLALAVRVSDSPDPVRVGEELVYFVDVDNPPPADPWDVATPATNLRLTVQLPTGVTFVRAFEDRGGSCAYAATTRAVTCTLAALGSNRPWGMVWRSWITVRPTAAGSITVWAHVAADQPNPSRAYTASEATTVTAR